MFDFNVTSISELTREFQVGYDSYIDSASLADGAQEVLERFKKEGINQVIISSFPTEKIKRICESKGILGYFTEILGADDIKAESKVERGVAFSKSRGENAKIVAIGDLIHDYEMASGMGADCILYSGGHQSKKDLSLCGVPVADSMKDIERMILE
jgi:phosphoglycolate phosphatase